MGKHDTVVLDLTTQIVAAYLAGNRVDRDMLPDLIHVVHDALSNPAGSEDHPSDRKGMVGKPAVPRGRSVFPDCLVCLEDGQRVVLLKRHLQLAHDMTPSEYRMKWRLAPDYPMVSPDYTKQRAEIAKRGGLGTVGWRALVAGQTRRGYYCSSVKTGGYSRR